MSEDVSIVGVFDEAMLRHVAGPSALQRGRKYHAEGRVTFSEQTSTSLAGEVRGSQKYKFWLKPKGDVLVWCCECVAASDGAFCKHLVAAVLTAQDGAVEAVSPAAPSKPSAKNALLDYLRVQPAERLAGWLSALAERDRDVEKRLMLYRAAEQPGTLKPALAKLLNAGGFLDYRRSIAYANKLDAGIELLEGVLLRDPVECRALCEYALGRLFPVYGRSDDSSGAIGECMHAIADLHARACAAKPPGQVLAKPLHALQCKDDWGLLALPRYWDCLGARGQSDYARAVMAEYEKVPQMAGDHDRFSEAHGVFSRTEALARCSADFELLQRVLRRDLSQPYHHLRVLESLREFGREREALAWGEAAVKRFPTDTRLRAALSGCLAAAGMLEEAIDQTWQAFRLHPDSQGWDALKRAAGNAWPLWRERALEEVTVREKGQVNQRVRLLLHDGDLAAAVELAREPSVWSDTLRDLAQRLRRSDPTTAGAFYLRLAHKQVDALNPREYPVLVDTIDNAAKLLPSAEWQPFVTEVRKRHARKTKLMLLLDAAGL